jgi:hypothetical protein
VSLALCVASVVILAFGLALAKERGLRAAHAAYLALAVLTVLYIALVVRP